MVDVHPKSIGAKRLTWRQPAIVYAFLGWLLAGALNPVGVVPFILALTGTGDLIFGVISHLFVVGMPSAIGVFLALLGLKSGKTVADLSRRLFIAAAAVGILYLPALAFLAAPQEAARSVLNGVWLAGTGFGVGVGVIVWVPAFFVATLILQKTTFKRYADGDDA